MTKKHEMNEQKLDKVAGGVIRWPWKPDFKPPKPWPTIPKLPEFPVIK